jgi:hypothetical protein
MAYPPVGFLVPFKILRPPATFLRRCLASNGRSASAAPSPFRSCLLLQARPPRLCPNFDAVRHRIREVASLRCPPRRRDPARSRADEHSFRRTRGASRASRASRFITDAGRPLHPLQSARRVDVAIAFDRPERSPRPESPKALVRGERLSSSPRLLTREGRQRVAGRMSRFGIPSPVRSVREGVAACQYRRGWVSVREEGARFEEVCPEWKLRHVPCVVRAVAGADAVAESVPRSPAADARRGVHSRSSWGF